MLSSELQEQFEMNEDGLDSCFAPSEGADISSCHVHVVGGDDLTRRLCLACEQGHLMVARLLLASSRHASV